MVKSSRELKKILPVCAPFFFMFVGAVTAQATTFYVATTGNDANSCVASENIASPKHTIASAVTCLTPGDTLYLRGGTYGEPIHLTTLGTAGNYITVSGYPGETAIIQLTNSQ